MDPSTSLPLPLPSHTDLTRQELIERSHRFLPTTPEGLPAGFYRADLVPNSASPRDALNPRLLDVAFVELRYDEGFPSLPDGRPFWHKLDFEPPESFVLFDIYTNLASQGPRHLHQLLDIPEVQRILPFDSPASASQALRELYTLYYWRDRARAYDLYQEAAYRHIRTRRAMKAEDYHYIKAEELLQRLIRKIGERADDFFDILVSEPDKAISVLEKLVKIQRVSAGMPSMAPPESLPSPTQNAPTDFEMILRQVSQRNAPIDISSTPSRGNIHSRQEDTHTLDEQGRVIPTTDNLLRGALNDPNTAKLLQEVIIRVSSSQGPTKTPRWKRNDHTVADDDGVGVDDDDIPPSESPHGPSEGNV